MIEIMNNFFYYATLFAGVGSVVWAVLMFVLANTKFYCDPLTGDDSLHFHSEILAGLLYGLMVSGVFLAITSHL